MGAIGDDDRDDLGRFEPGHRGGPGRKPNGVAAALRRLVDPDAIAEFVYKVARNERGAYSVKDQRWACEYIADRIDGKPAQSISMQAQIASASVSVLPADWRLKTAEERSRWIAAYEADPAKLLAIGAP